MSACRPGAASLNAQTFDQLDKNKDGQISREEAQANPAVRDAWSKLDASNRGSVSKEEFEKFRTAQAERSSLRSRRRKGPPIAGPFLSCRRALRRLSPGWRRRWWYRIFIRYRPCPQRRRRPPRASRLRRASLPVQLQLSPRRFASGGAGRARACARLRAIAITDECSVAGVVRAHLAAKEIGQRADHRQRVHAARRAEAGAACYRPRQLWRSRRS